MDNEKEDMAWDPGTPGLNLGDGSRKKVSFEDDMDNDLPAYVLKSKQSTLEIGCERE